MLKTLTLFICLSFWTTSSQSAIIYDNGAPNTTDGFPIFAYEAIDNFNLSGSYDINSIGFYIQNFDDLAGWDTIIKYNFYADNNGSVGDLIASGKGQNSVVTDSGLPWCCSTSNAFLEEFNLESTLSLGSGNYWMGLSINTTSSFYVYWLTTDYIDGFIPPLGVPGNPVNNDLAFYLDSSSIATPIPAAVWLFGSGLIGLIGVAKRKKA